jgi:hypothetical protein
MTFVELNRCFVPLKKDQEPILDVGVIPQPVRAGQRSDVID